MSHFKFLLPFLAAVMDRNLELGAKVSFSLLGGLLSCYFVSTTTERKLEYKVTHKTV